MYCAMYKENCIRKLVFVELSHLLSCALTSALLIEESVFSVDISDVPCHCSFRISVVRALIGLCWRRDSFLDLLSEGTKFKLRPGLSRGLYQYLQANA
jgi:hypothetical protein